MSKKLFLVIIMFMFIVVCLVGCNKKKEKIIIRGSTSVEPLIEVLMDKFLESEEGKNVEFDIKCEGSGKGREAVEKDNIGNVIGMSSSAIKSEDSTKFNQFDLAKDAVVMIVNKENNLSNITIPEIYDIYTGTTTNFTGISNNITVVARDAASGTREAFESFITNDKGKKLAGNMINTAEQLEKTSAVIAKVNTVKSAIGYISFGSIDDSIKVLNVNGVIANVDNVKNGTYVLYRPFVIITNAKLYNQNKLSLGVQNFIKFLQSDTAKTIIEKNKYIPIE